VLASVFPTLEKSSVDYAVMEPAFRESFVRIAALPLELEWMDIGSWLSYQQLCPRDRIDQAERIKQLAALAAERFGPEYA
jgi:mannose-1-phosphate guanylyltransferase